jgi:hypothetical protein
MNRVGTTDNMKNNRKPRAPEIFNANNPKAKKGSHRTRMNKPKLSSVISASDEK